MRVVRYLQAVSIAAALAALSPSGAAQTLVRSVNGPAANTKYGKACIVVSDQNGDGLKDLLVGAPGFNQERGAIYCISGAFLATGAGTQTLWSLAPTANPGDKFGFALADVGDVTGDGVPDFLVGQPGYDHATSIDSGAVRLVNGSTHAIVSLIHDDTPAIAFGSSMAVCGDIDFDGYNEVAVGAPGPSPVFTQLFVLDGAWLSISQQNNAAVMLTNASLTGSGHAFAASLAGGFDLDGDGRREIAVGIPGSDGPGGTDSGQCRVLEFRGTLDSQGFTLWVLDVVGIYHSSIAGERLGQALEAAHDYDGDGVVDIVVGAPNSSNGSAYEVGRVVVLSGARVAAQTPPYEIRSFVYGGVTPPANHSDPDPNFHFGAAVNACGDLNGDGVGEILIGAPDYFTPGLISGWSFRGLVRIYSGASGALLTSVFGGTTDRLGDALAGSIGDLNGDGFSEFVVAGSLSDAGGTDSGVVKCYRLFPLQPWTYCVGKVNSLGCTPFVSFSGLPSASSGQPFAINASNFLNQKSGLLFYSHAPAAVPFQGGTKCVASPSVRTLVQTSGGAASGSSCSGTYSFDFNLRIASGVDASLVAGADVCAQYWSRDPASPSTTSLSNAVQFVINP
ncbi:MAG: FG-GAP repeat protein [Planctomycetes bacterium]|nr:FG-GAP repeat protein [Planctomycetota bacterium]